MYVPVDKQLFLICLIWSVIFLLRLCETLGQKKIHTRANDLKCRPETKNSSTFSAFRTRTIMALRIRRFRKWSHSSSIPEKKNDLLDFEEHCGFLVEYE